MFGKSITKTKIWRLSLSSPQGVRTGPCKPGA